VLTYPKLALPGLTIRKTDVPVEPEPKESLKSAAAGTLLGTRLSRQLLPAVRSEVGLFLVASKLGVRPSTIRKILDGRTLSKVVERKIDASLRAGALSASTTFASAKLERLIEIFHLYHQERSLEAVGEKIGLTRERVRQLLVKGSKIGLFRYQSLRNTRPSVPKEKLLSDYRKFLKLYLVARANNISTVQLKNLRKLYGITQNDLEQVRYEGRKQVCVEKYAHFSARLGHPPSTTELQKGSGSYLSQTITKLWGSFQNFQTDLAATADGNSRSPTRTIRPTPAGKRPGLSACFLDQDSAGR